jgi:DUF1680 family protein
MSNTATAHDRIAPETLSGLLAYASETGNDDAFAATRKLADSIVNGPADRDSAATGLLLRPMLDLYRETGDRRYEAFCDRVARQNLTADAHTLEALRAGRGLLEYYTHTGDAAFLKRVTELWNAQHVSLTGMPEGIDAPPTCTTVAWQQLTLDLFRITGRPQYTDSIERTIYNQLLAGQDPATGRIYESVPIEGSKQLAARPSPCVLSEAVGLSEISDAIWGRLGDAIALLTYTPGRATIRLRRRTTVQIYTESNYPESGDVLVHIEPNRDTRFAVRLRVPSWTDKFTAVIGNTRLFGNPGDFVTLTREWRKGDAIRVTIDLPAVAHPNPATPGLVAFQRGPQMLVLDSRLNPKLQDTAPVAFSSASAATIRPLAQDSRMPFSTISERAFQILGEYRGKPENIVLTPFAEAQTYRMWVRTGSNP